MKTDANPDRRSKVEDIIDAMRKAYEEDGADGDFEGGFNYLLNDASDAEVEQEYKKWVKNKPTTSNLIQAAKHRVDAAVTPWGITHGEHVVVTALQKKFKAKRVVSSTGAVHLLMDYHHMPSLKDAQKFLTEQGFTDQDVVGTENDYGFGFILNAFNPEDYQVAYCPDVNAFRVGKF